MKNIQNICWLLVMCCSLSACKSALEENPKSLAVEVFYNTAAEVEAATNAIYVPLRDPNSLSSYLPQLETYVDYGYGRGSYLVLSDFQSLNSTNIGRVGLMWSQFYLSIRNANLVIQNAPKGKSISAADVNKFVAEARFMRAFNYFHLVRNWGGVPLRTEGNMTQPDLKRSTADEVYALIVADLTYAEANLPDVATLVGRPAKWAAKTMLADVYLQLARYPDARDKSNEVIQSGKYALVPVSTTDDFQKIFGPDVVTTPEEVFYFKFTRQDQFGNWFVMFLNHPGTKFHGAGGFYGQHSDINNLVYKNQDNADLRKGLWYVWDIGMGTTTTLNKKFIDPAAATQYSAGNDMPWYRYADVLLIYAEASCRAANAPTTDGMAALNQVHRRAFGKNPLTASTVDFVLANYNATSFVDLVIKERGYEFQYEGKRWLELKRTGQAQAILNAVKGVTINPRFYLWPIPVTELNYNKALDPVKDQNPGY